MTLPTLLPNAIKIVKIKKSSLHRLRVISLSRKHLINYLRIQHREPLRLIYSLWGVIFVFDVRLKRWGRFSVFVSFSACVLQIRFLIASRFLGEDASFSERKVNKRSDRYISEIINIQYTRELPCPTDSRGLNKSPHINGLLLQVLLNKCDFHSVDTSIGVRRGLFFEKKAEKRRGKISINFHRFLPVSRHER